MARTQTKAEEQARKVLRGAKIPPGDYKGLINALKDERAFGLARKVAAFAASDPVISGNKAMRTTIAQKRALCTYKDPDLPAYDRLEEALKILKDIEDLDTTTDRETLGLAGAIYKRRWEVGAQMRDLERSAYYYERGFSQGTTEDYGYTGINAAYVLDWLADQESIPGWQPAGSADVARARRLRAAEIRNELVRRLPSLEQREDWLGKTWWYLVTLAEAHLGLGAAASAKPWLDRAKALANVPDWERESTARQLAGLLALQRRAGMPGVAEAQAALLQFLGNGNALESVERGKVGLALSGGGFRASLYHIGVLARLAELDLLRSVEYLSCVSGGSIIGAYYYLEVRKLLQEKADAAITQQDYIEIVQRIEEQFLRGVQRNIRTRILAEWLTNVKLMLLPGYSRTSRAGELYERELYARVADGGRGKRWLNQLIVMPKGERADFRPKDHNWSRKNKVPILVLNATTLNTGHNWQFTATWMGEPPSSLDTAVDANYRLRRLYYDSDDTPQAHRQVRLGYAVAASACVPGIFEPLPLDGLYEAAAPVPQQDPRVRLVDGGVHDNQGTAALLEQGCSVLLVSDASGQMNVLDAPGEGTLAVPLRSNSILQARVREAQFRELTARVRSGLLKGLMFIHLKQGLDVQPVNWIGCQERASPPDEAKRPLASYGVQKEIQEALAAIRTDLDSFSDCEGYGLMCDGYLMCSEALQQDALGFPLKASQARWKFLEVRKLLAQSAQRNELLRQLKAGQSLFLKVWMLSTVLKWVGGALAALLVCGAVLLAYQYWRTELVSLTLGEAIVLAAGIAASIVGLGVVASIANWRKTVEQVLVGLGLATVGWILARVHLHVFDRMFLRQGRVPAERAATDDSETSPAPTA